MAENLILYTTEDGETQLNLREISGSVWLTQLEMAELFQTSKQNISLHVQNILDEAELSAEATVKEYLTVQTEANREVERNITHYALPMILAVGYRVRSPRGTQFRQWATRTLAEYLQKGFVLDDERLKAPQWDYFDELLARIRDIRASEKRFYQKVRELLALASDYVSNDETTHMLFAEVQNKLFFAVTQHTAAELIIARADPSKPNMNLTSFEGKRVRKADVIIAKNYLNASELDHLNRLVTMFLEFAEFRTMQKQSITIADWRMYIDNFMAFNEQSLLKDLGRNSHEQMKNIAHEHYEIFDLQRKQAEALAADKTDLQELEQLDKKLQAASKSSKKVKK